MTAQYSQIVADKIIDFRKSFRKSFRKDFISVGVKSVEPSITRCVNNFVNSETTRLREKWAIENYRAVEFSKLKREIESLKFFVKKFNIDTFAMVVKRLAKTR